MLWFHNLLRSLLPGFDFLLFGPGWCGMWFGLLSRSFLQPILSLFQSFPLQYVEIAICVVIIIW